METPAEYVFPPLQLDLVINELPIRNYMIMRQVIFDNLDDGLFSEIHSPLTPKGEELRDHLMSLDNKSIVSAVQHQFGQGQAYSLMFPKYRITIPKGPY